ncbi:hypothetical protein [Lacrimispora sp.]|uniref:hypothetical protein n=1 Tax=Lacrimispora sp. TaxID=2719234 RepID=UPI0028AEFCEF|nr:hypothetical protein [Lacrimispora sp.]
MNNRLDPADAFRNWLKYQTELVSIAMQAGYTRDQAIEMLKIYTLEGIKVHIGVISQSH